VPAKINEETKKTITINLYFIPPPIM